MMIRSAGHTDSETSRIAPFSSQLRTAPNDAKEILGHARISTTMEVYTHGDEEDQRSALDRMADALFGDLEG